MCLRFVSPIRAAQWSVHASSGVGLSFVFFACEACCAVCARPKEAPPHVAFELLPLLRFDAGHTFELLHAGQTSVNSMCRYSTASTGAASAPV